MMYDALFVVVGGGIAGVSCAEMLAFLNPDKDIVLITKSRLIKTVTHIVPVSKMLFNFDVEEKEASTLNEVYPNIKIIYDVLKEICSERQHIITEKGLTINYEYLCLCMGAQPKLIDRQDENSEYILGIRDTDSVELLQQRLKDSRRVLIVGNGGIASELVHELKNVEIIWAVKDDHISATFLDPGAAEFFQFKLKDSNVDTKPIIKRIRYEENEQVVHAKSGAALGPDWHSHFEMTGTKNVARTVTIEYQCEVKSVSYHKDTEWPVSVLLTNGKSVQCDLIISATGVTPCSNIKIDKSLTLGVDGGIAVDYKMETSIARIYAAGDVCTANWDLAKHWFQMRLWTQARQMGTYAAKAITSIHNDEAVVQDFCFEMFAHSTNLFGFKVALLGLYNGQKLNNQYECLLRVTPNNEYIKLVIVNGRIQGAILIGDTNLEETIENLILNQLDVTPFGEDLLNPDIDIEDYFD